jgi:hypothetical protein
VGPFFTAMPQGLQLSEYRKFLQKKGVGRLFDKYNDLKRSQGFGDKSI